MTLLLCAATGCSTPQPQKPSLSVVKGRVFLITVGGDLKPARMANVYLSRSVPSESRAAWDRKFEQAAKSSCRDLMLSRNSGYLTSTATLLYQRDLDSQESVVRAGAHFSTQADEDGRFSFEQVPPGPYDIEAFGRAGANLGFWKSSLKLGPGERAESKLPAPVVSCLVL